MRVQTTFSGSEKSFFLLVASKWAGASAALRFDTSLCLTLKILQKSLLQCSDSGFFLFSASNWSYYLSQQTYTDTIIHTQMMLL